MGWNNNIDPWIPMLSSSLHCKFSISFSPTAFSMILGPVYYFISGCSVDFSVFIILSAFINLPFVYLEILTQPVGPVGFLAQ